MEVYGTKLDLPFLLGTANYPSPKIMQDAFQQSKASVATVSLRRENASGGGQDFFNLIKDLDVHLLPNTAGCVTVKEAVTTAHMAREIFQTKWIKLELIGNQDLLSPDVVALVEATKILTDDGFQVFPYCTEDLSVADRLLNAGAELLMPWGAPIGSGRGLNNPYGLKSLRAHFPDIPLIIDAGLGTPSHAAAAMELGFDGILLNTAVAGAGDPIRMAEAFAMAVRAGKMAHEAVPILERDMAAPSTPQLGKAFLS